MPTIEEIQALPVIGLMQNNWRQRDVTVYQHPDPDMVYSVGVPFNGGDPVICEEQKANFDSVIRRFPKIIVQN